jgi:hypothetical protein
MCPTVPFLQITVGHLWDGVVHDSMPCSRLNDSQSALNSLQGAASHLRGFEFHNVNDHAAFLAMESSGSQFLFTTKRSASLA